MRNIQTAAPRDRTPQLPTPNGTTGRGPARLRDWIATLPLLLLVPALAFPFMATEAAGPSLAATPASVSPGHVISVAGTGFQNTQTGAITWDGSQTLATYRVAANGRFRLRDGQHFRMGGGIL